MITAEDLQGAIITEAEYQASVLASNGTKEGVEICGKCKREKVNGKCPACGRPTKYTTDEDMIAKVDKYLDGCVDVYDPETKRLKVDLPMLEGFALMLDINDTTLVEWRKEHLQFSTACRKIEIEQKKRLINMGLSNDYNAVIAKLNLSANHGMREKTDVEQKISGSISLSELASKLKQ